MGRSNSRLPAARYPLIAENRCALKASG